MHQLILFNRLLYFCRREDLTKEGLGHITDLMVTQLEDALDIKFQPGYNNNLAFMSHLWEDLRAEYRPICFYGIMEFVAQATKLIMQSFGFEYSTCGCVSYQ